MRNLKRIVLISVSVTLVTISSAAAFSIKYNKDISFHSFFISIVDLIMELLGRGIF